MPIEAVPNQSVERAAALLRSLAAHDAPARASDLATAAGLGLSTTSRLLATLESLSFVERDAVTGAYRLGPLALTVGGAAANQSPVYREARQHMQNAAGRLGIGVNLARRDGDRLLYLFNVEGPRSPRSFALSGQHNPLHATGLGKSLLAGLDAATRRRLVPAAGMTRFTAHTLTTHEDLDAAIEEVLARGYAVETEELALGRACVAAPVRDRTNEVVAAVSMSGSLSVMDLANRQAEFGQEVLELADTVSTALGYRAASMPLPAEALNESAG